MIVFIKGEVCISYVLYIIVRVRVTSLKNEFLCRLHNIKYDNAIILYVSQFKRRRVLLKRGTEKRNGMENGMKRNIRILA